MMLYVEVVQSRVPRTVFHCLGVVESYTRRDSFRRYARGVCRLKPQVEGQGTIFVSK